MILKDFYRKLGQTDLYISPIGLGTVKFGRNQLVKYPTPFSIPTDKEIINLLTQARALGINILDTAPAYGSSEERLGQLLPGNRNDWIIITKAGEEFNGEYSTYNYTASYLKKSLFRSLKRLQTDYIDLLLIHSDGNDLTIINQFEVFKTLQQFKTEGYIRAFGMSTKTLEGGRSTINVADVAMITLNPEYTEETSLINYAKILNKGILIKKGLASGNIQKFGGLNPLKKTFEFLFSNPLHSVIIGTINPLHLYQNVQHSIEVLSNI